MTKKVQLQNNNENIYPRIYSEYVVINLDIKQSVYNTTMTKVLFNKLLYKNTENLIFENNCIKIGKNINYVRVDLILWLEAFNGYAAWHICKNGVEETYNISPKVGNSGLDFWRTGNAFAYLKVEEGDIISAEVRFSESNANGNNCIAGFYHNSCNLAVQILN